MPSQRKCGQVGFSRTVSANSLTDVTKPLDVSITSHRITKRKPANRKRLFLKSLSLRRQKLM